LNNRVLRLEEKDPLSISSTDEFGQI
jgi:hypothetical protein